MPKSRGLERFRRAPSIAQLIDAKKILNPFVDNIKDIKAYKSFDLKQPPEPPEGWSTKVIEAENAIRNLGASHPSLKVLAGLNLASDMWTQVTQGTTNSQTLMQIKGMSMNLGNQQIAPAKYQPIYDPIALCSGITAGKLPVWDTTFYGLPRLRSMISPIEMAKPGDSSTGYAYPTLYVIQELEIATFLGDYGAGKTVQTFSLLPGEKTTISVRTWRTDKTESAKTENILDSLSRDSQDTYEGQVENEFQTSTQTDFMVGCAFANTHSTQTGESKSGSVGGGGSFNLGIVKGEASGGYNWASQESTEDSNRPEGSVSATTTNAANTLQKALDKHVNQSSSARKHEVKVESKISTSTDQGRDETINRTLENINHSRALNFVFRALNQEFLTVVYLKDVSVGFTKGLPGDGAACKLDCLDGFLSQYLKEKVTEKNYVADIRNKIIGNLLNVCDYNGTQQKFVEQVSVQLPSGTKNDGSLEFEERFYWRKKKIKRPGDPGFDPNDPEEASRQWKGKWVDGIILSTASRILPTDAIIVDALLGQGEALDCYNMRLQNAAADNADINNERARVALDILQGSSEELKSRADAFAKMFNPRLEKEDGHSRSE